MSARYVVLPTPSNPCVTFTDVDTHDFPWSVWDAGGSVTLLQCICPDKKSADLIALALSGLAKLSQAFEDDEK